MIFFLKTIIKYERSNSIEELNKCSVRNCGNNITTDRENFPVTDLEKQFGLMCMNCIKRFYNENGNLVFCQTCSPDDPIDLIVFKDNPELNNNERVYCEKCRDCCGDELEEQKIIRYNEPNLSTNTAPQTTFFQKILNKINQWRKQKN